MKTTRLSMLVTFLLTSATSFADGVRAKTDAEVRKLQTFVKPRPQNVRWEEIPWRVDLWEARREAAKQGKPLYLWSAGGAPPIGGC